MNELIMKLARAMGLHPELWLSWQTCTPDWIVGYAWWFGAAVSLLYLVFTIIVGNIAPRANKVFNSQPFFIALALVFTFCSVLHFLHVQAKYEPEVYTLVVFIYPALVASMIFLIYTSGSILVNMKQIVLESEMIKAVRIREERIRELESKLDTTQSWERKLEAVKRRHELYIDMINAASPKETILITGNQWDLPIFYDRWTSYAVPLGGNFRHLGVYPNGHTTMIIAELDPDPETRAVQFPEHAHDYDETITSLTGEFEVTIDKRTVIIKEGDTVHIPAGAMHGIKSNARGVVSVVWNTTFENNIIKAIS